MLSPEVIKYLVIALLPLLVWVVWFFKAKQQSKKNAEIIENQVESHKKEIEIINDFSKTKESLQKKEEALIEILETKKEEEAKEIELEVQQMHDELVKEARDNPESFLKKFGRRFDLDV